MLRYLAGHRYAMSPRLRKESQPARRSQAANMRRKLYCCKCAHSLYVVLLPPAQAPGSGTHAVSVLLPKFRFLGTFPGLAPSLSVGKFGEVARACCSHRLATLFLACTCISVESHYSIRVRCGGLFTPNACKCSVPDHQRGSLFLSSISVSSTDWGSTYALALLTRMFCTPPLTTISILITEPAPIGVGAEGSLP